MASPAIKIQAVQNQLAFEIATVQKATTTEAASNFLPIKNHPLALSFLRTVIYFDVFDYPLNEKEIFAYCDHKITDINLARKILHRLTTTNYLNLDSGFYYLGNDNSKIKRRVEGNKLAAKRMRDARFYSRIIAMFPFTRGVYISGSLSKNYMDKESDIDYFIITKPGRLWLNRTLLVLFKRLFLFNSNRNFCINYVIDTDNLAIPERNVYAATETVLLLPMYNHKLFNDFLEANLWFREYYPNYSLPQQRTEPRIPLLKRLAEKMLDNALGDKLENYFYKLSVRFWKKKHKEMDKTLFERNLKSARGISRYHPQRQQFRILDVYYRKIREFETATGLLINKESGAESN
ncbi:MAG: nucleotidyltransferase domain-containing protein [Bacteroidales bacterium]|nr:nucleotidyltransferase domain-containing protein [Bacteroidales bacterium]